MELKTKVLLKVASLIFLLGFTATTVDAGFNPSSLITQLLSKEDVDWYTKPTEKACCDKCICTRSIPPQCHCNDVGETCHSECKRCICTRSIPPSCRCADITDSCYKPCHSDEDAKPNSV
ncbi:Proteinase inhibitor I12 [Vigna unguiculata]|uniref:Proteinase inhibitor I12 n=1 Tax=Vigna unguiculata TaxID=3917 RepID=A0A4D6NI27_VIGUN|nr:Proteinase inhibitor I12 [Vigna unguiculata]